MNRTLAAFALVSALALSAAPALADGGVPQPLPGVPLVMKYEKDAKTHTLVIPKKFLEGVKVGQLDGQPDHAEVSFAGDNGRTILAGCALSMAVGSVVFLRRRHVSAAVVLVAGAVSLGAGSLCWADKVVESPLKQTVIIELVEKGDAVTFISPSRR
jgi:hypothetical protein